MTNDMFSIGLDVVTAAFTLLYMSKLLFQELCSGDNAVDLWISKRSLEGQHIARRAR